MSFLVEATNDNTSKPLTFSASNMPSGATFLPLGDTTGDGAISSLDSSYISQYATGTRTFTDEQKARADINRDGLINTADSNYILDVVVGKRLKPDVYVFALTLSAGAQPTFTVTRSDGVTASETVSIMVAIATNTTSDASLLTANSLAAIKAALDNIQKILNSLY